VKDEVRKTLEKAVLRYLAAKPWDKLKDEHVFGVKDEATGMDGWCSVAGHAGEEHGLGLYVGKEGRKVLEKTLASDLDVERQNEEADVIALTVADEAEAAHFRTGTKLDCEGEVRGKKVVPIVFRKPAHGNARALRDAEGTFLARALEGIARSGEWGLDEDDVLDEIGGRLTLALTGTIENLQIDRSYDEAPRTDVVVLTAALEQRLHEAGRTKRLKVGWKSPKLTIADPKAKKPLHEEELPGATAVAAATRLVEVLAGRGPIEAVLPREIWTDDAELEKALGPALAPLGVTVKVKG
jgi:hypothetical protein